MNPTPKPLPAKPGQRPAHRLGLALDHHKAHRKRSLEQAAAHFAQRKTKSA